MDRIYLDHAATTPLRPEAAEAMARVHAEAWGNPSSPHAEGRTSRNALETARRQAAASLGVPPGWVHFVRGGTESDNLALLGRAGAAPDGALLISALEHSAIREPARALARAGRRVIVLPVSPRGEVEPDLLEEALSEPTRPALVSVQQVNSECGLLPGLGRVQEACSRAGVPLHVDAAQAPGHLPLPDMSGPSRPALLSLSAHKFGGPRGVGILVREAGLPLAPVLRGGSQESGIRPGTEDVAGAAGTAAALQVAVERVADEALRLSRLRDRLQAELLALVPGLRVLGGDAPRAPHLLLLALPGVPRDLLPGLLDLEGVAVSAGSACRSGSTEPGPALEVLAGPEARKLAPLRFSLGWTTTAEEVEEARIRAARALNRTAGAHA